MTSSTKPDLVEHVARAICEARGIDPDEPTFASGSASSSGSEIIVHERRVNRQESSARAAIIATLQYARDNVSNEMVDTGMSVDLADGNAGEDIETRVSDVFRAMINTLLKEIGGGKT